MDDVKSKGKTSPEGEGRCCLVDVFRQRAYARGVKVRTASVCYHLPSWDVNSSHFHGCHFLPRDTVMWFQFWQLTQQALLAATLLFLCSSGKVIASHCCYNWPFPLPLRADMKRYLCPVKCSLCYLFCPLSVLRYHYKR